MKHSGSAATVAQKRASVRACMEFLRNEKVQYAHSDGIKVVTFLVGTDKVYLYPASCKWHVRNSAFGPPKVRGTSLETLKKFIEETK